MKLAALLLLLAAVPVHAELTVGTPAPEFPRNAIWLGGPAHYFSGDLKGKVVLVDFWEYTCINCIRTFPHLKELYNRYHPYGFEIIGVHKGEFAFASNPDNVRTAYRRFKLPYPAIADVRDSVWTLYDCNSWPDSFLIDGDGIIRDVHQGEGDYAKLEMDIQRLLKQKHPELDFSSITIAPDKSVSGPDCGSQSEEIYVGYERGSSWGGKIANREGFQKEKVVNYKPTSKRVPRGFFVSGKWLNEPDDFEFRGAAGPGRNDYLGITYHGRDVYAVLDRGAGAPVTFVVTRDGKPIPEAQRGQDITLDPEGRTIVTVDASRMYYIVTREDDASHELRFYPRQPGTRICSFTFGNKCQESFDRL